MIWRNKKTEQKNRAAVCSFTNEGMVIELLLLGMHQRMSEMPRFCVISIAHRKSLDEEL